MTISVHLQSDNNKGPKWRNWDTFRDHQPGDWSYPTYLWKLGEIIEDRFFVRAHKKSALGKHSIFYGLYLAKNSKDVIGISFPEQLVGKNMFLLGKIEIKK